MRVLFWSSTFPPSIGGVQVLAAKLLPALEERGYRHVVVTQQGSDQPPLSRYEGIPVYRFPFWSSMTDIDRLARVRREVADLKRAFAPDLIHINAVSRMDFFHHLTAHAHPASLLVTLHAGWLPEADRIVERTLCSATWVVGCSKNTVDIATQKVPEVHARSSVIHNCLPKPWLSPAPLSFDPPRLLCLGRLVEDKGFDIALAAFSTLLERFPEARLTIAGEGPAKGDLERQACRLGTVGAVHFPGRVEPEEIARLINTASVVVVPSRLQESFGLVALEAASMGRPVVAARVGGLPEVVLHERTGLLIERENPAALAKALAFLLDHPETAKQFGQAGRERALEHFSWDRYVDSYDSLYRSLISGGQKDFSLPSAVS